MTVNTYPDLFFGYAAIWLCIFIVLLIFMVRGWKFERRLIALTKQLEAGNKIP